MCTGLRLLLVNLYFGVCHDSCTHVCCAGTDKAIDDLQEAVNVDSRPASGHNNLGLALCEAGRYEEALSCFDTSVDRQPENPTYLNNRALANYHLGKLEAAITDLDTAIGIAPNDASAYFHRGNAMLAAGRPSAALADLQKAYTLTRTAQGLPVDFDDDDRGANDAGACVVGVREHPVMQ